MAENNTGAETSAAKTQRPLPRPSALSAPFWAGARQHKLLLQRCGNCNAYRWTPQVLCPECFSEKYEWTEVSGLATVQSFTIVHRPPSPGFDAPYALATVELKEGPLMLTNI